MKFPARELIPWVYKFCLDEWQDIWTAAKVIISMVFTPPAENMEKSQDTNFSKDTTKESASVACSNVRLWKLDTQKELRNMSWRLWDERTKKDSAGFMDSKENKWVGS